MDAGAIRLSLVQIRSFHRTLEVAKSIPLHLGICLSRLAVSTTDDYIASARARILSTWLRYNWAFIDRDSHFRARTISSEYCALKFVNSIWAAFGHADPTLRFGHGIFHKIITLEFVNLLLVEVVDGFDQVAFVHSVVSAVSIFVNPCLSGSHCSISTL